MTSYRKYPLSCIYHFELRAHLGLPSDMALIFILGIVDYQLLSS
jgi:hypothetical protein